MHYYGDMGFFGMHFFWWFFWFVLVIGALSFFEPVPRSKSRERKGPLEILQRRYASGELTDDEYEKKKSKLEQDTKTSGFAAPTKA